MSPSPGTLNDEEFHASAAQGGASRAIPSGTVPDRGYMVGGVPSPKDNLPYPEINHPVESFEVDHVRHHARALRDEFGENSKIHQGAWVSGGNVTLDASEQINHYYTAVAKTKARGEKALYDVEKGRDVHVL